MGKPILLLIGLSLGLAILVIFFFMVRKFIKGKTIGEEKRKVDKKTNLILLALTLALGTCSMLFAYGICLNDSFLLNGSEKFLVLFGSFIVGISFAVLVASFYLRYWCIDLEEKQLKTCKILIPLSFVAVLVGLLIFTEGIANQDIYPLINGININQGFTKPHDYTTGLTVKFYGIIIVSGAFVCYFITDHETYKKFGEHGLIDTLFIVSFLAGLIGSRLWYCLVLEPDTFLANPSLIISGLKDGGLAIMGGAIGGSLVGILFVIFFRKYIDVRFLMDVAIPSILLAQVIGRWGNFFNQEVYGMQAPEWLINLLPTIIKNNMYINGEYKVPLFLIEGIINVGGYLFIRLVLGKLLKCHWGLGYQAGAYFSWYGLVRVILEPLRNPQFEYTLSIEAAWGMIVGGLVLIAILFAYHKIRMNKGLEDQFGDKIKA